MGARVVVKQPDTYTELEVLTLLIAQRDVLRVHPAGRITVDRDEAGHIIGLRLLDAGEAERPIPPDHGLTTGRAIDLGDLRPYLLPFTLAWAIMIVLSIVVMLLA